MPHYYCAADRWRDARATVKLGRFGGYGRHAAAAHTRTHLYSRTHKRTNARAARRAASSLSLSLPLFVAAIRSVSLARSGYRSFSFSRAPSRGSLLYSIYVCTYYIGREEVQWYRYIHTRSVCGEKKITRMPHTRAALSLSFLNSSGSPSRSFLLSFFLVARCPSILACLRRLVCNIFTHTRTHTYTRSRSVFAFFFALPFCG